MGLDNGSGVAARPTQWRSRRARNPVTECRGRRCPCRNNVTRARVLYLCPPVRGLGPGRRRPRYPPWTRVASRVGRSGPFKKPPLIRKSKAGLRQSATTDRKPPRPCQLSPGVGSKTFTLAALRWINHPVGRNNQSINPHAHGHARRTAERVHIDLVGQSVGSSNGGPGEPTFS